VDSGYIFRAAGKDDIDGIHSVEAESFTKPWSLGMFTDEITNNDRARYYVIEYNTEIIAYGGYWCILDEAHITNVAVRPGYRNRGIGEMLLSQIIGTFGKENIIRATLEVGINNKTAIGLYKKAGFTEAGIRKGYYENSEDAVIMWKEDINKW
jgi:[ribosomal protein S18]-alanine N-acetyltransferase